MAAQHEREKDGKSEKSPSRLRQQDEEWHYRHPQPRSEAYRSLLLDRVQSQRHRELQDAERRQIVRIREHVVPDRATGEVLVIDVVVEQGAAHRIERKAR